MSHHGKLRENKRCENCGHFVEKRFCPECGQENIETRQRFHYLFIHFFEDFVHYDGRFWKTIQYLLFRPAKLTREYLAGKRNRYVPPVTLYIFISFITFFLPAILPTLDSEEKTQLLQVNFNENKEETGKQDNSAETDKQRENDKKKELSKLEEIGKNFNKEKWEERIVHDFPKAIFIYMPFFAFWLWLFHNKKKWLYFDHGIYTLHYFSFTLLSILIILLFHWIVSYFHFNIGFVEKLIIFLIIGYLIYYFFHSHRLLYRERKAISRLKCSILFFINSIFMLIFIAFYVLVETFISNPELVKEGWTYIKGHLFS